MIQLYLNLSQHQFHSVQGEVPSNSTRSAKLRGARCSPKLAFRSTGYLNKGPSTINFCPN